MPLTESQLYEGLDKADQAGNAGDIEYFSTQIKTLRAGGGQAQENAVPLGNDEPDPANNPLDEYDPTDENDPLATVAVMFDGYELPGEVREAILAARSIKDPQEQRMAQAKIAGVIDASTMGGNAADKFNRSQLGAGVRSIGTGFFGIGDYMNAAATAVGSDMSFLESLEAQRVYRHALEGRYPITTLLGEIGGAVVTGRAAIKGASALAGTGRVGKALKTATVFSKGQGAKGAVANTLRAAAAGGLSAGFLEGVSEGDVGAGARGVAIGSVAGPLGLGVIKVGGHVISSANARLARVIDAKTIKAFLTEPAAKTVKLFAKKLGETEEVVARRLLQWRAATGKNPSMAELANKEAGAELHAAISRFPSASSIAREGKEALEKVRGKEFATGVRGGKLTTTEARQLEARARQGNLQFEAARGDSITFSPEDATILDDVMRQKGIGETLKKQIKALLHDASDGDQLVAPVTLSGKQFGAMFQDLQNAVQTNPTGSQREVLELMNVIGDYGREQSKKFGQAMDEFASRSAKAEGVKGGRKILGQKLSEAEDVVRLADADKGAGLRVGARSEVTDVARESYASGVRLAQSLTEEGGRMARLRSVLPKKEADKIAARAKLHAQSAESLESISPSVRAKQKSMGEALTRDAMVVGQVAMGKGVSAIVGAGIMARNIAGYIVPGRLSKKATENLARDMFNPSKIDTVLPALRKAGMSEEDIMDMWINTIASAQAGAAATD